MYINNPLKKYLDDLGAKLPAPGGGSAAALTAALGTSLINMVCNFTLGKEKYKDVETQTKEILGKSEKIKLRLEELIDLDVKIFKSKDMKKSLDIPLEICRLSFRAALLCPDLARLGNPNLITDVGCAIESLVAAFTCGRFNVEINLKNPLEGLEREDIMQELDKSQNQLEKIKLEVNGHVSEIIRR